MNIIPEFDHNHVLPPHVGNPTNRNHVSPYLCSIEEFCERFGTTKKRLKILIGFLEFRLEIYKLELIGAFQWLDGSFTENIETSENRSPNDIDVITLFKDFHNIDTINILETTFPEFTSSNSSKEKYFVDHYPFPYADDPDTTVEMTRYWIQLFSHNRLGVWKGMLKLEFNNKEQESALLNDLKFKYESL